MRDRVLSALCLCALTVQILLLLPGLCSADPAEFFSRPDTSGYLAPAMELASGNGFGGCTERAPGFPFLLAWIYYSPLLAGVVLSIAGIAAVFPVYAAALRYAGKTAARCGAGLFLFNLTAMANRPLWLSDTLFGLFTAWEIAFLMAFLAEKRSRDWLLAILFASLGTLIRPINIAWIYPALFILLVLPKIPWRKKGVLALAGLSLAFLIPAPWQLRNARLGAGYCIDTNTGAMLHQNGAMILAAVHHSSFEEEKARILHDLEVEFADTARYPDIQSRTRYRLKRFREIIFAHPGVWIRQHFRPHVLLPDLAAFCEDMGLTSANRGTLDVMQKQGVWAAVMHYFDGRWYIPLLLFPLLIPTGVLALGVFTELVRLLKDWRQSYPWLLILLAGAEYYFFLPGPITVPRYQIPALPVLCIFGGAGAVRLRTWVRDRLKCTQSSSEGSSGASGEPKSSAS